MCISCTGGVSCAVYIEGIHCVVACVIDQTVISCSLEIKLPYYITIHLRTSLVGYSRLHHVAF